VWLRPRNEPPVEVDRAVLVMVHHQTTVLILTTIRALPQWHVLLALALVAHPGRIALINYREFFPIMQTLVPKHLHKAVESPVIIDHAVTDTPLPPLLGGLLFLFLDGLLGPPTKFTSALPSKRSRSRNHERLYCKVGVNLFKMPKKMPKFPMATSKFASKSLGAADQLYP
jgi:hypothetical protein